MVSEEFLQGRFYYPGLTSKDHAGKMDQAKVPLELFQKQDATVSGSHNPKTAQENRNSTFIEKDYLNLPSSNSKIETSTSTNLIIISADDNQPQKYSNNNITNNNSTSSRYSLELDSNNLPNGNSPLYDHPNTCDPLALVSPRPQVVTPPVVYPYQLFQVPLSQDIAQTAAHRPEQAKYRNKYGEHTVYEVCGTSTMNHPESNIVYTGSSNNVPRDFNTNRQPFVFPNTLNVNAPEFIQPNTLTTPQQMKSWSWKERCTSNKTWGNKLHAVQTSENEQTQDVNNQVENQNNSSGNSQVKKSEMEITQQYPGPITRRLAQTQRELCYMLPQGIELRNSYAFSIAYPNYYETSVDTNIRKQDTNSKEDIGNSNHHVDKANLINRVKRYFVNNTMFVIAAEKYEDYQNETFHKMEYVVELFTIPRLYTTRDLLNIYKKGPCFIKWCDDHHALFITNSSEQATRALSTYHHLIQSRPMTEASPIANLVACSFKLFSRLHRQISKRSENKIPNSFEASCASNEQRRMDHVDKANLINRVKRYFVNNTMFVIAAEKYEEYQNETFHKMEYVVELFNIPRSYTTRDLLNIYKKGPCFIKWCDDHHALFITNLSKQATRALSTYHHLVQSRPMIEASPIANLVACNYKPFSRLHRQISKRSENKIPNSFEASCKSVPNATNSTENYSNRVTEQLLRPLKAIKIDENTAEDGQLSDKAIVSSSENMQTESTDNNGDCNTTTFTKTSEAVIHCDDLASGIKKVNLNTWKDFFARRTTLINKVNKMFRKNASIIIATENYDHYQNKMFDTMGHVIELFNIPKTCHEKDLLNIYQEEPRYIIWCDDTTALLVTGSTEQAQRAVLVNHEIIKSRAMEIASLLAIAVACEFVLLPASRKSSNKTQSDSDTGRHVGKKNVRKILQLTEDDTTSTISSRSDYDAQIKYAVNKPRNNAGEEATSIGYGNIVALKSSLTRLVKRYFENPATVAFLMGDYTPYQNQMEHVIELYNIPPQYSTPDVSAVYREQPSYIKWCDNTHALLVTSSAEQANRALLVKHASIKSRRMIDASPISAIVDCKSNLHLAVDNQYETHRLGPTMHAKKENKIPCPKGNQPELDIEEQLEKSNPEVECASVRKLDVQTVDLSKNSEELPEEIEQEHHENTAFQPTDSNGEEVMASVAATENAEESADIAWEANGSYKEWTFNAE